MKTDLEITPADLRPKLIPARLLDPPDPPLSLSDHEDILAELRNINHGVHSLIRRAYSEAILAELRSINHKVNSLVPRVRIAINATIDDVAHVKMRDILGLTARYFGMNEMTILSARRSRNIVRPRQIAMYLCKELTPRSYPEIALFFRGLDHTTVLHGVRVIERLKGENPAIAKAIEVISNLIKEKSND